MNKKNKESRKDKGNDKFPQTGENQNHNAKKEALGPNTKR